jgi:hypothetical protein
MKARKGYYITDSAGFTWEGDCPAWAVAARKAGKTVTPIRIYGTGRWSCSACQHHLPH